MIPKNFNDINESDFKTLIDNSVAEVEQSNTNESYQEILMLIKKNFWQMFLLLQILVEVICFMG